MSTDDTENYMFTRTITDDHGRHGGLYHHTDKRGCTRTMRRIIVSLGRSRMATENFWIILLVFLHRISVDIRDNPCEKQYRIIPWMFMECHGGLLYIWYARTRIAHMHIQHHACYHQKGYAAILHPASCCSGKPASSRSSFLSLPLLLFFWKKPTFPTPGKEKVSKIWLFRVKDRV